ncbi:hypothetical protein V1VFAS_102 [Rhizobium phage V1VFA-S]|nr:hypothetical protein V1VFAS_102 [Rhizobium phage V1VFA-S]
MSDISLDDLGNVCTILGFICASIAVSYGAVRKWRRKIRLEAMKDNQANDNNKADQDEVA